MNRNLKVWLAAWDELREMAENDVEIDFHLDGLGGEEITCGLVGSKVESAV